MPDLRTERELNDLLWERVRLLLPPRPEHPKGGRPFVDDRACFEGIVFVLRNGCRWRALDLIDAVPSGVTCWRRYRDWTRAGVWEQAWQIVLEELREAGVVDTSELALDASFVEAKKGGPRSAKLSAARG